MIMDGGHFRNDMDDQDGMEEWIWAWNGIQEELIK